MKDAHGCLAGVSSDVRRAIEASMSDEVYSDCEDMDDLDLCEDEDGDLDL
jgi:hypothetical protein